jgi:hypothetical protein
MGEPTKAVRDMTFEDVEAAAERMPADIREWFEERAALLADEAGLVGVDARIAALALAREEYQRRKRTRAQWAAIFELITGTTDEFSVGLAGVVLRFVPQSDGGVVIYRGDDPVGLAGGRAKES